MPPSSVPLQVLGVEPAPGVWPGAGVRVPGSERAAFGLDVLVSVLHTTDEEAGASGPAYGEARCAGPCPASMHRVRRERGREAAASPTPWFGVWDPCESLRLQPNDCNLCPRS